MWQIVKVKDHYNLYYGSKFVGSADNFRELDELKREFKREYLNKDNTVKF